MMVSIRENLAVHLEFIWTRQMPGMPWGAMVKSHPEYAVFGTPA
jgi:hypothetical protein